MNAEHASLGRVFGLALGAVVCSACDGSTRFAVAPPSPGGGAATVAQRLEADEALVVAADPRLPGFEGWPIGFEVAPEQGGATCSIAVLGEASGAAFEVALDARLVGTRCEASWDGRDASGALVEAGTSVTARARVSRAGVTQNEASVALEVVRLGVDRVQLSGEEGARQPLLYRSTGGMTDGFHELAITDAPFVLGPDASESGATALDLADGTPRAIPTPWDDLTSPPLDGASSDGIEHDAFNLPSAWVAGSAIDVDVRFVDDVPGTPHGGAPRATEVRLVAPTGFTLEGDGAFEGGREARFSGAPVTGVGRFDIALDLHFEARSASGEWQPIPGHFPITLRLYGLVDAPVFAATSIPHRPWVDVVDTIAGWVGGGTSDPDDVGAAIVRGVYEDSGLAYDRERGASMYTEYRSGWGGGVFSMQAFQDRAYGSIINCSDAASIVSSYANMVGLDFRYRILTHRYAAGFTLNYLKGIGASDFTFSPFTSGRNSFRYHAIVSSRDVRTWDATLAVDGDGAPSASPFRELLVQGLDPTTYLEDLSPEASNIVTQMDERTRIQ